MKIAIIGADGQLGTDLCKVIPQAEQLPLTIKDIDITDKDKTFAVIKKINPDYVINTAAYHHVDKCEDNEVPAFQVNTFGPKNLAQACQEVGAVLVQISTDYVFDGKKGKPYIESDCPRPLSIYGVSKLAGEYCVQYTLAKYLIIRTTGLYGTAGCLGKGGGNFVENMIKRAKSQSEINVVDDEKLCPTYTLDLAKKIYELIKAKKYGICHVVNSGGCSWYEFTLEIFKLLNIKTPVRPVKAEALKPKVKRPKYSVLTGKNIMRSWQEALKAYLNENSHCS